MSDSPKNDVLRPKRTIFDAFNSASYFPANPTVSFGTGTRPPLSHPTSTPGPGAYPIKTTMAKVIESNIKSPCQFSIRARTKFGDPNEKVLSRSNINMPGPGQYDLTGKFLYGTNPRQSVFPKGEHFVGKLNSMTPGPGAYGTWGSMGHQLLSTKGESPQVSFAKSKRKDMVQEGASGIGPGEYGAPRAACDEQVDSRKPSCCTIKIGGGYKKGAKVLKANFGDPSPGPGSYKLPTVVGGKDSRKATLSGRTEFGSPFARKTY